MGKSNYVVWIRTGVVTRALALVSRELLLSIVKYLRTGTLHS